MARTSVTAPITNQETRHPEEPAISCAMRMNSGMATHVPDRLRAMARPRRRTNQLATATIAPISTVDDDIARARISRM